MSSQQNTRRFPSVDVAEEDVVALLMEQPDFFDRHPQVLAQLALPHEPGSGAVSLIERQVQILRERNTRIERKLRELVKLARANDALVKKVHKLCLRLIEADGEISILSTLEDSLQHDFAADHAVLILFGEADDKPAGFVRRTPRGSDALKPFNSFLKSKTPRCGQLSDAQREFLFDDKPIGSAALVPLGSDGSQGFLSIGSLKPRHFHPTMGTDFLGNIGSVVGAALANANAGASNA
ncbi:MAG: DUF484 family protein [Pseudomonadota bacterium]